MVADLAGSRLRQIGWMMALAIAFGAFLALTFQVNTVKSEVTLAERKLVALQREKLLLETEFQARANQQQLSDWNAIEFGYEAPRAEQYLDNERELAGLGEARGPGAPEPIRVVRAPSADELPAMVSPLTGQPAREEKSAEHKSLAERLAETGALGAAVAEAAQ